MIRLELLDQPYTPNEMGFLFFCFVYYKFLYPMTHNSDGSPKGFSSGGPDSQRNIYKNFKIFMPFDFDNPKVDSLFATQAQTLILYKQFQGTVLDLFKFLYPEPIFEFNTYETEDSNILIIRPTPFMAFSRKFGTDSTKVTSDRLNANLESESVEFSVKLESSDFDVASYDIIESDENGGDFGFKQVKNISDNASVSFYISEKVSKIADSIQKTIDKPFSIYNLLPNYAESMDLQNLFFNIQLFNNNFIESLSMQRSSNSVVNIIWTTPVTDTAVLNLSGRAIVFAKMQEALSQLPTGTFDEYIYNQFAPKTDSNPVFLWNYKNQNPNGFVSGDINYYGIREMEIKWNFMTFHENALGVILRNMNQSALKKIKDSCKNKSFVNDIDSYIQQDSSRIDVKGVTPSKTGVTKFLGSIMSPTYNWTKKSDSVLYKDIKAAYVKPKRDDGSIFLKAALQDPVLIATLQKFGFTVSEIQNYTSFDKLIKLLTEAQGESVNQFGLFAKKVNNVVSKAFRENEHLYEMGINTVINTSVLPGMILESFNNTNSNFNRPRFKGYVTSVSHILDFSGASLKTIISLSRSASDDSGIGA